jgi:hypothetical protein
MLLDQDCYPTTQPVLNTYPGYAVRNNVERRNSDKEALEQSNLRELRKDRGVY